MPKLTNHGGLKDISESEVWIATGSAMVVDWPGLYFKTWFCF